MIKALKNKLPDKAVKKIIEILKKGGIIAFPTDTVYGIAADPNILKAVKKLFWIKKRALRKAIPILISSKSVLKKVVKKVTVSARILTDKYWPGALTIILPKSRLIPSFVTKGSKNVAIRIPDNKIALQIIKAAGGMLAVTSANISGKKEATSAIQLKGLKGIDLIIDGGKARIGKASTIVDLSGRKPQVLRQGSVRV